MTKIKTYVKQNEEAGTLFFMPDISGFTKYVNDTEIDHSQHIITELLEILADTTSVLDLTLLEIEGDAVFFFKFGDAPSLEKVLEQCKEMFIRFHAHLKRYERDRTCQCGACSTANKLTLKFVVHYGKATTIKIKTINKLLGKDVIVIHRLLKNDIDSHEYVLLSDNYMATQNSSLKVLPTFDWIDLKEGATEYKALGEIKYKFFSLHPLQKDIIELSKPENMPKYKHTITLSTDVNTNQNQLYAILTNLEKKPDWMYGLRKVKKKDYKIERIGSQHECLLPMTTLDVKSIQNNLSDGKLEYAEEISNMPFLPQMNQFFIMDKSGKDKTLLTLEITYNLSPFFGFVMHPLLKGMLRFVYTRSLRSLKKLGELGD